MQPLSEVIAILIKTYNNYYRKQSNYYFKNFRFKKFFFGHAVPSFIIIGEKDI